MGAFGAALIARERYVDCEGTTMLSIDDISSHGIFYNHDKMSGCTNNCRLTINHFSGGRNSSQEIVVNVDLEKRKSKNQMPNLI